MAEIVMRRTLAVAWFSMSCHAASSTIFPPSSLFNRLSSANATVSLAARYKPFACWNLAADFCASTCACQNTTQTHAAV